MVFFAIFAAGIPAAVLLTIAIISWRDSRQPLGAVIAEYAPLPGSSVLFDAVLADAESRALPAALVDLAIRKKIRLVTPQGSNEAQQPAPRAAKSGGPQLSIELVPGAHFTPQEHRVLAVFLGEQSDDRAVRRLATDRGAAGKRGAALLADTIGELAARGLIAARTVRWASNVVRIFGIIGLVLAPLVAIVCATMWGSEATAPAGVAVAILAFCAAIAALIVCPRPWRRFLPPSLPVRRHLAGMQEYIRLAEADRLRVLQSPQGAVRLPASPGFERLHVYEQLLPYAILFGQEKEWAEVLRAEASSIDASAFGEGLEGALLAAEAIALTIQIAIAAGHIAETLGGAGQIVDAGGAVLEGIGDLLSF